MGLSVHSLCEAIVILISFLSPCLVHLPYTIRQTADTSRLLWTQA